MSDFSRGLRNVAPVTIALIVINVAIYVIMLFLPARDEVMAVCAVAPIDVIDGSWWTFFTSMFLHSGIMHILCNMFSLYYLGAMCEKVFGSVRFLVLYLVSGIFGNIAFVAVNWIAGNMMASAVGASGAIFGLFGAYGWLLLKERKQPRLLAFSPDKSAVQSYVAILAVNLAIGFAPGSNIANEAHIGGMIAGFIVGAVMYAFMIRKRGGAAGAGKR